MKFNKLSQLLMVSSASLAAAGAMTACGTATTDYVFVSSSLAAGPNSYGQIDVFEINAVSGAMRQIPTSPFPSGGRNPVAEAVSSDYTTLYVVNENDNNIVQFAIGSDGKIYPENTVNTPGVYPLAVAVTATNLFVLDTYEPLSSCSIASPCSGSVAVFPLAAASGDPPSDMIGPLPVANPANSLNSWPLTLASSPTDVVEPTAIDVLASGSYAYVTAYDATTGADYIFGFSIGAGGALTPLNSGNPLLTFATGSCSNAYLKAPFIVGTCPSAIASASNSAGNYLYVTDTVNGKIHGYKIAVSGALSEVGGSPYAAGNQPTAIAADSSYPYLYVANTQDGNVEAYSISASGELSFADGSTTPVVYDAGLEPVAIGIDPSTNHFVFTANYLGNNVSDFELNATTGTLIDAEHSPFKSNALVTAVAAVPHHATQQH